MSSPPTNFRPAPYALGALAFLMPFVTMSCPGGSFTFSGMDLVFGTTVQGQHMNGEPLVLIALALCGIALYLSFRPGREAGRGAAAAGGLGAVLLIVTQSKLHSDAAKEGMVQLSFQFGYWLALVSMAAGAGLSLMTLAPPQEPTPPGANTDSSAP